MKVLYRSVGLIAERLEFEQQDYPAALAGYARALDRATDPETRAELATATARVQKNSARYPDAIASYHRIARDFGQVRSAERSRTNSRAR